MTVKQLVNESLDRDSSRSDLRTSEELLSPNVPVNEDKIGGKKCSLRGFDRSLYGKPKVYGSEIETDQESIGSSDEMESPRSVAKFGQWTPKNVVFVHSQILRIREEDSHLGDDIGEGLSTKDKVISASGHNHQHRLVSSHMDVMLFSRPILPASPLSGKTSIKTVH